MNTEQIVKQIEPLLRDYVDREAAKRVERLAGQRLVARDKEDAEILRAAKAVGEASDRLAQARFSGAPEIVARMRVTATSERLAAVMKKHGRLR